MENVIFLDRDGVINVKANKGKYITKWSDFQFLPNVISTLQFLSNNGFNLFIITNQQCVEKKIITHERLELIHNKMLKVLNKNNIEIIKVYYCPHLASQNCECRKPKPGMLFQAAMEFNINIKQKNNIYLIGDSQSDIQAGNEFGCKTVLVKTDINYEVKYDAKIDYLICDIIDIKNIVLSCK